VKSKLDYVKKGAKATGRQNLIKHLSGQRLTQRSAIAAHCYECMGYYSSGKESCLVPECPLYPFMPYKDKGTDTDESEE